MTINSKSISDSEQSAMYSRRDSQKEIEKGIASFADTVRANCSTSNRAKKRLGPNFSPGPRDVILARGKKAHNHAGNDWLRQIIHKNLKAYSEAPSKLDKSFIVSTIMDTVRQASNGGGFVRDEGGKWYEVGDRMAREKISQSFRDLLHTKYSSSTKAKARLKDLKAKAEVTACNERQKLGLINYTHPVLMEQPSARLGISSHGGLQSDLINSSPKNLHTMQYPSTYHGGTQNQNLPMGFIRNQAPDMNPYHIGLKSVPTQFGAVDARSNVNPIVSSGKDAQLTNHCDHKNASIFDWAKTILKNNTVRKARSNSTNADLEIKRPFFPVGYHEEDSDLQSIDWLQDEGVPQPYAGSEGIDSIW